jgi:serine/threonine protein kinase
VGVKVAGALQTAHGYGFLHRDMKPQNILVTQFGDAALADFGVAALQATAQATAGVFGFTTLHAAPEILEGQHLSPATDVYGLASTMYQLLSGLAPFAPFENEAPASVILRIIRDPVPPLRSDDVPLALSDLLEAALSKDPAVRPQTAWEFAGALGEVEFANGWPHTSCVVWDKAPSDPRSPLFPLVPATGDSPATPVVDTSPAPLLYPSAPSVQVAEGSSRRAMGPPDGGSSPAGRPTPSPLRPDRSSPAPSLVSPLPPVQPRAEGGPSTLAPQSVSRKVVRPEEVGGRQPGTLPDSAKPPLAPLNSVGPERPPGLPARPVYVDPDERTGPEPDISLAHTRLPANLAGPIRQSAAAPDSSPDRPVAALLMAGVGVAIAVIIAAVLLIAGVL